VDRPHLIAADGARDREGHFSRFPGELCLERHLPTYAHMMIERRAGGALTALVMAGTFAGALAGCSAGEAPVDTDENDAPVSATQCKDRIDKRVLTAALNVNETASIVSRVTLYGDDESYADAVLVRVSDEVDPSDYIVVRSRLRGNLVTASECKIDKVFVVADGVVPDDDDHLLAGKIGAPCMTSMKDAVLVEAMKLSETAQVVGTKALYGGDLSFGGAVLIRVSDEVEPSDYLAVFSQKSSQETKAGTCKVEFVHILNSGVLPEIDGLSDETKPAACTGPGGVTVKQGASIMVECNSCTCNEGGRLACTELFCGTR
jgi:hypothetical protein